MTKLIPPPLGESRMGPPDWHRGLMMAMPIRLLLGPASPTLQIFHTSNLISQVRDVWRTSGVAESERRYCITCMTVIFYNMHDHSRHHLPKPDFRCMPFVQGPFSGAQFVGLTIQPFDARHSPRSPHATKGSGVHRKVV